MSTALVTYINSSFLESFFGSKWVGVVFSIAYVVTLIVLQNYGRAIARFGNSWVLYANMLIQAAACLALGLSQSPVVIIPAFILFVVMVSTTIVNYDIYLKALAPVAKTGRLRGLFWTMANLGFLVSPLLTGRLVDAGGMPLVYKAAALLVIPAFILMYAAYNGNRYRIPYRHHEPLMITLRRLWTNTNIRGIFIVAFALYFFYSWMVVYTPLYLLEAGFDWNEIGLMFTVMLLPFVIVEYPAGYLADRYFGETEMLTLGLGIMAVSVFTFMTVSSFTGMMIVLFCSRVGASLVEIMRESYFYKIVKAGDLDMIDTFRNTASFAYVVAPILATAMFACGMPLSFLFLVLGLMLAFVSAVPGSIEDTR